MYLITLNQNIVFCFFTDHCKSKQLSRKYKIIAETELSLSGRTGFVLVTPINNTLLVYKLWYYA